MGLAGYKLTPQVKNIVGLDPALPMFYFAGPDDAISRQDAKHVQIIHTNAGFLETTHVYENRHELEVAALPVGHHMHDVNGKRVPITKERGPPIDPNGEITFKLYTKQSPSTGRELKINDRSSLINSGFDSSKPTYMITHGWINNENGSCVLIRDAYLTNTDANVIVIDWSSHSMSLNYIDVSYEVKGVAKRVQQFIEWLYDNGLNADDLTLVGHSLGAHVMGLAGYKLTPQVKNIVGLDPALPMFYFAGPDDAISRQDAKHVQIIHTNAGFLGYACPHGHSDFYLNDGTNQPGCCGFAELPFVCTSCSHTRVIELFAESISTTFTGIKCTNYVVFETNLCGSKPETARMGGPNIQSGIGGTYYLWTNSERPFSDISKVGISPFFALLKNPHADLGCGYLYR